MKNPLLSSYQNIFLTKTKMNSYALPRESNGGVLRDSDPGQGLSGMSFAFVSAFQCQSNQSFGSALLHHKTTQFSKFANGIEDASN